MTEKPSIALIYNLPVYAKLAGEPLVVSEEGKLEQLHIGNEEADASEIAIQEECEALFTILQTLRYRVVRFGTDGNLQSLLNFLEEEKPQLIFNLCEGVGHDASKEMNIAAIFELLNIPFTGSGALTLGTSLQKTRVKEILTYHNIPTPKFQLFNFSDDVMHHQLHFPLIVKPSREDASIGIENTSIVKNNEQLYKRVHYIHERFSQPALVEEFIDGREINAAILGFHNAEVLPLSEIDMSTLPSEYPHIITYNAKWMKGTIEYERTVRVCPAPLPKETEEKITSLALKAFHLLGCRDYARVDFRLSHNNEPYILEVNPNPDISEDAGFAASALAAGYSYHQFVEAIIHSAMERLLVKRNSISLLL